MPHFFRRRWQVSFERTTLELPDGDFIDLDRTGMGSTTAALLLHGLEGSSDSHYIKGMCRALKPVGCDIVAMNFRGCSGRLNRKFSSYHSGKTDDLDEVVTCLRTSLGYERIFLAGFSLGGNMCLKYFGEKASQLPASILGCAVVSVPCDLKDSALALKRPANYLYMRRFMRMLREKTRQRAQRFPEAGLTRKAIDSCRDFASFDNLYTAPAHGFESAEHYWTACSSKPFIPKITRPSLIINAKDDPFFGRACHPVEEAGGNPFVTLLSPEYGGHVGFSSWPAGQPFWHEKQVCGFFNNLLLQQG